MTSDFNTKKLSWKSIIKKVVPIAASVLIVVLLRVFVIGSFSIPSESMTPTLKVGDITLVNYLDKHPKKGDVVVFQDDNLWLQATPYEGQSNYLIKRVAAVGGDTIEGKDGEIFINGKKSDSKYMVGKNADFPLQEVPEDSYFMLGDNREYSADSRYHIVQGSQYISQDSIIGTAFFGITFSPLNMRPINNG